MLNSFLYFIWACIPLFFFALALYAKLEQTSGKRNRQDVSDFFRQGFFVLIAVLLAVGIDKYLLEDLHTSFFPPEISIWVLKILLLPAILLLLAMISGPSKQIRITKAPQVSDRKSRKK